jgi:hypothetical protein
MVNQLHINMKTIHQILPENLDKRETYTKYVPQSQL